MPSAPPAVSSASAVLVDDVLQVAARVLLAARVSTWLICTGVAVCCTGTTSPAPSTSGADGDPGCTST